MRIVTEVLQMRETEPMTTPAERAALRAAADDLFGSLASEQATRATMVSPAGVDERLWLELGEKGLGVLGLHIPAAYGGAGQGFTELAEVLAAAGTALACVPLLSSAVLTTYALLRSADEEACARVLPAMIAGTARGALAVHEDSAGWSLDPGATRAVRAGPAWYLSGTKAYVVDGGSAHLFVVSAQAAEGPSLFVVAPGARGILRDAMSALDLTRPLSRVTFEDTPAVLLGQPGTALRVLREVVQLASVAIAAEQAAIAERVLHSAVDHARTRIQFGRAIGSFQAVKHRCADMAIAVETARAVAAYGVRAAAGAGSLATAAPLAKAYCSDALFAVAAANIQIHGGIGFTWEHPAHLYFKRAKADYLYLGDPVAQRRALATELSVAAAP
jgi:alkylation response protein AidB-like acyl-CoA dehydrogenase